MSVVEEGDEFATTPEFVDAAFALVFTLKLLLFVAAGGAPHPHIKPAAPISRTPHA